MKRRVIPEEMTAQFVDATVKHLHNKIKAELKTSKLTLSYQVDVIEGILKELKKEMDDEFYNFNWDYDVDFSKGLKKE
jgi:hypothetical protein